MKKLLIAALFAPLMALAQTYPAPIFNALTIQTPLAVSSGGTGASTSTGSGSVVLSSGATLTTPNLGTPSAVILTNGAGLPVAGVAGLGSGVAPMLGSGVGTTGGAAIVGGSIAAGNCVQWSASGLQDAGAPCGTGSGETGGGKSVNVVTYGAAGNSNGTHGNGTDSTSAFQSAFTAAAGGSLFIPCGTYRLTLTISVTDNAPRYVYGNGACTKIFNDATTAQPTFSFSPSTGTCSSAQGASCVIFRDLTFTAPNVSSGAQVAIALNNENGSRIEGVNFVNQNVNVSLTNSYALRFIGNMSFGGAYGIYSTDTSLNGGEVASSGFFGMTGSAVYAVPAIGCIEGLSIHNNDLEEVANSLSLGGVCAGNVDNNYIENARAQLLLAFSGTTNSSISFKGNTFNGATDSGAGTLTIQNVVNAQFIDDYFLNVNVVYGGGASQARLRATENTLSAAVIPSPGAACTGAGTGATCAVAGDDYVGTINITTGASPATTGTATLMFTHPIGQNNATCALTPVSETGMWSAPTLVTISTARTAYSVAWTNAAALTASKVYGIDYQCNGH